MEIRFFLITILVVVFALLHYGEARMCYICDSKTSKTCASEPSSRDVIMCPTNICSICNYKFNGTEGVIRSCITTTYSLSVDSLNCLTCYEDFCNNANMVTNFCNNANMVTVSMKALGCFVSFWVIRFVLTNSY